MFGKINAAIVGTGNIAGKMADTLKYVRGVRKYAVISRDADRARNFAASKGFKKSYGSLDEALEDKKIDFVYIATPHTSHYETAKKCLEHGKNVLCEKPMTINSKQAQELFEIAKEKELLITEAMWTRFTPFAEKVRQEVRGKAIGEPVYLTANEGANIRSIERMTNPALGGGALLDLGIYAVNAALMFFGNDVLSITPVCTYTDTGVDEQDSITIKYKNGRMAQLSASMVGVCDQQIRIYGTRGYMVIEGALPWVEMPELLSEPVVPTYRRTTRPMSSIVPPKRWASSTLIICAPAKAVGFSGRDLFTTGLTVTSVICDVFSRRLKESTISWRPATSTSTCCSVSKPMQRASTVYRPVGMFCKRKRPSISATAAAGVAVPPSLTTERTVRSEPSTATVAPVRGSPVRASFTSPRIDSACKGIAAIRSHSRDKIDSLFIFLICVKCDT